MSIYLQNEFNNYLNDDCKTAINAVYIAAKKHNINIFLIGGVVRDLIMNNPIKDIDITVEGDAIEFAKMLEKYDYKLVFYPHYEVQPLIGCFVSDNKRIVIADRKTHSLDDLLRKAALMITDYSSVAFDFAYMRKPVIYYQFDKENFLVEYGGRYFVHEKDGFGPVVRTKKDCIQEIVNFFNGEFNSSSVYAGRSRVTFPNYDKKNCERIYERIKAL